MIILSRSARTGGNKCNLLFIFIALIGFLISPMSLSEISATVLILCVCSLPFICSNLTPGDRVTTMLTNVLHLQQYQITQYYGNTNGQTCFHSLGNKNLLRLSKDERTRNLWRQYKELDLLIASYCQQVPRKKCYVKT
jgi:hypothetical protein